MSECLYDTPVMENKHAVMLTALQVTLAVLSSVFSPQMRRSQTDVYNLTLWDVGLNILIVLLRTEQI